ncbi:MAG TPA: GC-type dockerin domain-anchored protein [Phycisphaerales bacterium]|nr:GC-type dockerin domain-anchored protein [Phycisphaerales bacterium]
MITRFASMLAAASLAAGVEKATAQDQLFTRNYGGAAPDGAYDIEATSDGGFIASGFTESFSPGSISALSLVKTDANGDLEWSKTYELSSLETHGAAVEELPGGGYAVAGRAGANGGFDSFLLRADELGNELWHEFYDAGDDDRAHGLALTPDGGFILAGQAWFGDDLFGSYDFYLVKTDANGAVEWTRVFEHDDSFASGNDVALDVESVSTGGYILAGFTQSDVWAGWVIRTDELGNPVWDRVYDPNGSSGEMTSVEEVPAGGFILGGAYSTDFGDIDMALVRTDESGNPLWERTFGVDEADEGGEDARVMPDGGFMFVGMGASFAGGWDMYLVRTDAGGNQLWSDKHGGGSDDRAHAVAIGRDKLVAAGWAWSFGSGMGDVHLAAYSDPALSCAADFNGDGSVDTRDVLAFLNIWTSDGPGADFNGDGAINTQDVLAFLNTWTAGC